MDPFTEKLLARTQARKAALAKKREEVAGRSPVVTPRRPLTENDSNTVPSTPTEFINSVRNPPKGTPVVVTSAQFAGGTPKSVFFEKYAKQASLKQKECFIELGEGKSTLLKTTPKKEKVEIRSSQVGNNSSEEGQKMSTSCDPKENVIKASLVVNTESPTVKDRKAMYMKQVQVVSSNPAKSCLVTTAKQDRESENAVDKPCGSDRAFPSMKGARASLAGGRFFNDPRSATTEQPVSKITEKIDSIPPAKPPRTTAYSKEQPVETVDAKDVPSKPVPPPLSGKSQVAIPPSKPPRFNLNSGPSDDKKAMNQQPSASNLKRPAPAPPTDNSAMKVAAKTPGSIQKTTKRCEDEIKSDIPVKKLALESNKEAQETAVVCADVLLSPRKNVVEPQKPSSPPMVTVSESTPTQENQKGDIKCTLKSQKISAISLDEMDVSSAHEITFNIDMTEFDEALEEEKHTLFQLTYEESIKAAKQKATEKSASDRDEHDDIEMAGPHVHPTFKGVHRSGYNSAFSDQYAAMVTPKKVKAKATRNYTVHERIQMLLEEAAYQQNIVLQASQAVNTCLALHEGVSTGSSEEVEAERLLKFSTERRTACLDEVQKLKTGDEEDVYMNEQTEDICKATLTVSGIKISVDQGQLPSKNSPEPCIYSFICIIKHNPKQMYCTKAVTSDEIKNNCITFDDKFEIKSVKHSFGLSVSIFVLKTLLPLVNPTNKHKRKTMIAKSVLDSPKFKQIMGSAKKGGDGTSQAVTPGSTQGPVFRTSGFTLASTTHIDLGNIYHGKHKMNQVEGKPASTGDLQLKIVSNPEYSNHAKGFLTVFEDVGGLGDWLRYWCILDGNVLQYWKYPDEELIKPPLGSIDLGYCASDSVMIVPRDICARPHTMQLVLKKPVTSSDRETLIAVNAGGEMLIKYMLSADTKADKITWLNTLNDSLKDWRAWHHNQIHKMKNPR